MKKYIILFILSCFVFHQGNANESKTVQDSVKFSLDLTEEMEQIRKNLQEMGQNIDLDALKNLDIDLGFDSAQLVAMKNSLKKDFNNLKADLKEIPKNSFSNIRQGNNQKTPTRIEKKSFSNISEIEFFHSYGNIIVKESTSKQVDLEIQYFDTKKQKAESKISTKNNLLTIGSSSVGRGGSKATINFIISIPKNITLNIDLKYGDVKIDQYDAPFQGNFSYGKLTAQKLANNNFSIKMKYGELKIEEAKDLKINASYSDIRINKANRLSIIGNYSDYILGDVQHITTDGGSSYGDIRVKTLGNINANLKYADVLIDNLTNEMDVTTSYGDITIRNTSKNLKKINVKANYADVYITIPTDLSASFDVNLIYGDLSISKQYKVDYTESSEKSNKTIKKGKIGTKNPTASIVVTNNYADVRIK